MKIEQLKHYIVEPVLKKLKLFSEEAVALIVGTAMTESLGGEYIHQVGGPACGIYQMEPRTAKDILENYLPYKPELQLSVRRLYIPELTLEENLISNLPWATAMCRIHYLRVKEVIPKTIEGRAKYWKKYYNTSLGKGRLESYLSKAKGVG